MIAPVPAHIARVKIEKEHLDTRLDKLLKFILTDPLYPLLDAAEQGRLKEQSSIMRRYSEILEARIQAAMEKQAAIEKQLQTIQKERMQKDAGNLKVQSLPSGATG
jgi:hypothetical protein